MKYSFNSQKFLKENSVGFTLIELLVVTAIIGVLSATFLLNYRNTAQEFALQRAAYKLTQDIRRAGEMAMSAKECCGGIVPSGYGIYMEEEDSDYILYADLNGNGSCQPSDEKIEPIELEKGVAIQNIDTDNKKVSINFKPPSPEIEINNGLNEVVITLAIGGNIKTIKVNSAGLAYVE